MRDRLPTERPAPKIRWIDMTGSYFRISSLMLPGGPGFVDSSAGTGSNQSAMNQIEGKSVHFREDGLSISAYFGRNPVGRVRYIDKGDGTVLLSDVDVDERVEVKHGTLARTIRRVLPDWGVFFPRRNGIGSELLERFIRACEHAGVVEIYGNVTPNADRDQPFLRGWYEGFGFVISPPDGRDECIPTKYKVIWKRRHDIVSES